MRKFRFTLRAVTVIRTNRELRAQAALAAAREAAVRASDRAAAARERALDTARSIAAARAGSFRAPEQASFLALHRRECAAAAAAEGEAAAARAEAERCLAVCVEARRDLKIVTRLEEKARAAHRTASLGLEQQQMEELSRSRTARAGGGGADPGVNPERRQAQP